MYVPVDVIKERLQVQDGSGGPGYKGGADALVKIWKSEGLLGCYRGYGATLMSFGPFSALYFVFYEQFKSVSTHVSGSQTLTMPFLIASSASAGAIASFLTSPLDLAKLRLQVRRGGGISGSPAATSYQGIKDCLQHAYHGEGVQGLFRGAGARVLHFVPATSKSELPVEWTCCLHPHVCLFHLFLAITMTSYESARQFFHSLSLEV